MCLYTFCIYYTSNRLEICCVVHPMRNIRRKELGELEKFRVQQRNKLKGIVIDQKFKCNQWFLKNHQTLLVSSIKISYLWNKNLVLSNLLFENFELFEWFLNYAIYLKLVFEFSCTAKILVKMLKFLEFESFVQKFLEIF